MQINFSKYTDGLVPAIVQDNTTKNVLMLGFMNEEAFKKTQEISKATFYSRSKKRLWTKGETSGNYLNIVSIKVDCDNDTILLKVNSIGAACHTGAGTCFNEENVSGDFISVLEYIISQRRNSGDENSYVKTLFSKGINKIAQKVGEEATELIIEAKDTNDDLFLNEAADLFFHYLILLQAKNYKLNDVVKVLKQRR